MTARVNKIDESSWDKELEPFEVPVPQTEGAEQSSSRAMKMWKVPSFGSQSSGTDLDMFEIDWDLCFICQIAVCTIPVQY